MSVADLCLPPPPPVQSLGHLSGLLSACLAWRRLHSALLHYCAGYRAELTSPDTDGGGGMTSPLAPLDQKRWTKLAKLEAAADCGQLMVRGGGDGGGGGGGGRR